MTQKMAEQKVEKESAKERYPQTTGTVLMIPPNKYAGWNEEAAKDNKFMEKRETDLKQYETEYDRLVEALKGKGIDVILATKGTEKTPDSIFPNNWLSLHDGTPCIYPMRVVNRRLEIRQDIIELLKSKKLVTADAYDMTAYVEEEQYFEGTGALVLDRGNRIAYCNLSLRSYPALAVQWANRFGYKLVLFEAFDDKQNAIYHTNVMISVGSTYAIVCLDSIKGKETRQYIANMLQKESNKELIPITIAQMKNFCGNVLELQNQNKEKVLAMSDKAYKAFSKDQIKLLTEKHGVQIIHPDIDNIEKIFGGGVRCMIAEVF